MEYDIEKILTMYEDDYTPAIGPRAMVGEITDQQTQFGRPIYQTPGGERVSEKSTTLFLNGNWMNVPSIHGGKSFNEDELRLMIKRGNLQPTSVHKSKNEAEAAAKARSDSMVPGPRNMAYGGRIPFGNGKRVIPKTVTVAGVTYPNKNTGSIYFNPRDNAFIVRLGKDNSPNKIYKSFSIFNYGTKAKAEAAAKAFRKEEAKYFVPDTSKIDSTKSAKFRKFLKKELSNLKPGEVKNYKNLNELAKKAKVDITSRDMRRILQEPEFEGKVTTPVSEKQKKGFAKKFRDHLIKISKRAPKNKKLLINLTAEAKKLGFEGEYKGARDFKKLQNQGLIKNLVVSFSDTQKAKSNAGIIRLAEELRLNPEVMNLESPKQAISELATNIYGDASPENLRAVSSDAARYAEHLTGIRKVDGLRILPLEKRADLLSFILDDTVFSSRNGANSAVVDAMNAIRDSLVGDKPGTLGSKVYNLTGRIKKGYDFDHIAGISATYENAPGYSELGQVIKSNINRDYKKSKIDTPFSRLLNHALGNTNKTSNFMVHGKTYNTLPEAISAFNDYSKNFQKKYNVDSPILKYEPGKKLNAKNYITNYSQLSKGAKQNIDQLASRGIVIENKSRPIDMLLKQSTDKSDKNLNKLLKDFEARGCGKAAGGRILFSNGGEAITTCAKKGIAGFIDDIKKGNYSKATMNILKGGGNLVKNILDPKELVRLKNYFGPTALGFMGLFEAGVITDDVIRQGTPLNESLANNWLTRSFLPYTKDYAQAKNLLESGTVPSNMRKYVEDVVTFNETLKDMQGIENRVSSRLVDIGGYGMGDGTSMYSQEQQDKEDAAVIKKLSGITDYNFLSGSAKDLEYKKMLDEMEATRMAKPKSINIFGKDFQYSDGFSPLFGFGSLKDRNQTVAFDDYISPVDTPKDLRPITYMDAEYEDVKTLPAAERKRYEDYFTEKGFLKPRQSLSELKFGDSNVYEEILKDYNKFQRQKEASQYPGYYGTQYSEGGIASLNVKK